MANNVQDIIDRLSNEISLDVGNTQEDELDIISDIFDKTLSNALKSFNSSTFDEDGFIKRFKDLSVGDKKDNEMLKNILNGVRTDFIDPSALSQNEFLLRRDLHNICTQMPEMRDVIYIIRDAIIECNVSTGEVSRAITFENHDENETYESQVKEIENKHDLLMAIKNFIVPRTLTLGEMYVHVIPYSKLFAELEAIRDVKYNGKKQSGKMKGSRQSADPGQINLLPESYSLYNEDNMNLIMESISPSSKAEYTEIYKLSTDKDNTVNKTDNITKGCMESLLKNINIQNHSSLLLEEMGPEGLHEFLMSEQSQGTKSNKRTNLFYEDINNNIRASGMGTVLDDNIKDYDYSHIKGCYIKYLDSMRIIPIRLDRKVIGYYYVSATMDIQMNSGQGNGMVDLSFQRYTKDKNLVDRLASIIIKSFDKKMLEKNIKLKSEIAEVIMAHKFSEGRLSFIFIPEDEIVRFVINEDENGKGHSVIEPTIFPARMYLMLTLYNMIYTLNNTTTRVHYIKSSGLNKNYAAQIQRAMRRFQSRRITIDDIYSYSGVLNKIGGMGEMVLPSGRGDYKAIDTDTIEAVPNPINIEFLDQQRRQSVSGTGVPHLMITNAIDEVEFAKTLEMANSRFLSTVSSYKIDFNRGFTKLYQVLLKHTTDQEDDVIQSFRFQFNAIRQQNLNITVDMIQGFNSMVEMVGGLYYSQEELQDKDGRPTPITMHLRRELAKDYLPQLDFDNLDEIINRVNLASNDDILRDRAQAASINTEDLKDIEKDA